jgi:hypothetical protein
MINIVFRSVIKWIAFLRARLARISSRSPGGLGKMPLAAVDTLHDKTRSLARADGEIETNSFEWLTTVLITVGLTLASTVLLLVCTSPEFSWDEASRLPYTSNSWSSIWSGYSLSHGPMSVYLAKLGQDILPASIASNEVRSRFLIASVSSIGIGFLYWALRHSFKTSRLAAIVGCCLLMLSFIRLEETEIVEAHQLMLACTLAVAGLGYQWRESPTLRAAIWLGGVMGLGALAMTYVIPLAVCLAIAVCLAGKNWFAWDRAQLKIAWALPIAVATSIIVVIALWPPGVFRFLFLHDFMWYLRLKGFPTIVGDQVLPSAPRWAALYWLTNLELPLLMTSVLIIPAATWKAFKSGQLTSRHTYILVFLTFFLATALTAHMAGARNLLQFIGVLCLVIGALFDEALGYHKQLIRLCSTLVCLAAALNLAWLSVGSSYIPAFATDGYRVFVKENKDRLREKTGALVSGSTTLQYYAEENGIPIGWFGWQSSYMRSFNPWEDATLGQEVKYVLIPECVWRYEPPEQTMRHEVAEHWRIVWEFRGDHVWALRLYERP